MQNLLGRGGSIPEVPENFEDLKEDHDLRRIKEKRDETATNCELCDAEFSNKISLRLVNRNPIRHCKHCGRAICDVCSKSRRQISKNDPEKYRVCDQCDFEMDNVQLKKNLKAVNKAQADKIEIIMSHMEQL